MEYIKYPIDVCKARSALTVVDYRNKYRDFSEEIIVPKVFLLSTTGNAIAALNGFASTDESHQNSFLLSGLKIMHGERVGIQVHQHHTNQIKTRQEGTALQASLYC